MYYRISIRSWPRQSLRLILYPVTLRSSPSRILPDLTLDNLCPVRALHFYLNAVNEVSPSPVSLFVTPSNKCRRISSNANSFFLRQVIREGDVSFEGDRMGLRAHSIRGVGTSLAYKRDWSCQEVMEAAMWRSNTVFTSFYLNELEYELDDVRSLGPFIAANQVIN